MRRNGLCGGVIIWVMVAARAFAQDSAASGPLHINEFMASNVLAHENSSGDYEDWIEIYNSGNAAIDLSGYYLTDSYPAAEYWMIAADQGVDLEVPARGYLVLYADKKTALGPAHLNFKLRRSGEQIVLIGRDGTTVIDSISYPAQFRDISYGRSPAAPSQWVYFTRFTPGAGNEPGHADFVGAPTIDQEGGFYDGNLAVSVVPAHRGDAIHYTLDGSDPGAASPRYEAPVRLDRSAIFKARAFKPGALPSPIVTRPFFIDVRPALPVLTLMTDPRNLFDPDSGIMVHDKAGRGWERFAELAFFEQGKLGFHLGAGLRVQGNTGPKEFAKKSFRTFFRAGYGERELNYALFPADPVTRFTRLVLRSGYDDSMEPNGHGSFRPTLLRDPLVTELWRRAGGLTPLSRFAVLYLNDGFNGVFDIKQSVDEKFVEDHMGYGEVDLLRTRWDSIEVVHGERKKWDEMIEFFAANSFAGDAQIAAAAQMLDLENFSTLQALIHVTQYTKWAYGVSAFRERAAGSPWQWTIWDADRAFEDPHWNGFTTLFNPMNRELDSLMVKKLLENETYKNDFVNRTADLLNTVWSPQQLASIIDSLARNIAPEMPAEVERWGNEIARWEENVDYLKSFAARRPAILRRQMQDYFQLGDPIELSLALKSGKGKIKINSAIIERFPWAGTYFAEVPVTATALPEPGYYFVGWADPSLPAAATITLRPDADRELAAAFAKLGSPNAELVAPRRIRPGQHLPFVVRLRDAQGAIDPLEQTPLQVVFDAVRPDTLIEIKRGAGTGVVQIDADADFVLRVQNARVAAAQKAIEVSSLPVTTHAGVLPAGEVVWDSATDHLVAEDITVPRGTHLIIERGAWVMVKKYLNFYVEGRVSVRGSAAEPVVITAEKWSEPWGGMEFENAVASFEYCMVLNGGGDLSKGFWHTGRQHVFFGKNNSQFDFDQCFFLNSPGKVFGAANSKVTITNSVSSFVWHGGEFHRVLLFYQDSHLMNLPNDDSSYERDIDTDGLHLDYINLKYPQYSVIDRCYFVTGKDDAIDHHNARLMISNCWLEDFEHEGVAASGGDTVKIFNTIALNNGQGFEAGYTDNNLDSFGRPSDGPFVFIDHSVAVGNDVGLRIGDSYNWDQWSYRDRMTVTNSVLYDNGDNIWNFVYTLDGPLEGALEISNSITNDPDFDALAGNIAAVPQFDPSYFLLPGSPGAARGMGRLDSTALKRDPVAINEIMYRAPDEMDTKDWIELYNSHAAVRDLSGWLLRDDDDEHTFRIPAGTILPAGGYWILCADTSAFRQYHPEVQNLAGNIPFGFGVEDQVRLFDAAESLVDSVAYRSSAPWPASADGKGFTLELLDSGRENAAVENWVPSRRYGGTPGRENRSVYATSISAGDRALDGNLPTHFALGQNYPNPFNYGTLIDFSLPPKAVEGGQAVELGIYNLLGQKVVSLVRDELPAGTYRVRWDGRDRQGFPLASGIYLYRLRAGIEVLTRRLVLLR